MYDLTLMTHTRQDQLANIITFIEAGHNFTAASHKQQVRAVISNLYSKYVYMNTNNPYIQTILYTDIQHLRQSQDPYIAQLIDVYNIVKHIPVCKSTPANTENREVTEMSNWVMAQLHTRNRLSAKLDLTNKIGLNVYALPHYVTNPRGTPFIRVFYYLNDELTSLAHIMAIAQATGY